MNIAHIRQTKRPGLALSLCPLQTFTHCLSSNFPKFSSVILPRYLVKLVVIKTCSMCTLEGRATLWHTNTLCTRLLLIDAEMLASGSSMQHGALLLLGLRAGAPRRAIQKLKKLYLGGFLASMSKVAIAVKPQQRGINLPTPIWWSSCWRPLLNGHLVINLGIVNNGRSSVPEKKWPNL